MGAGVYSYGLEVRGDMEAAVDLHRQSRVKFNAFKSDEGEFGFRVEAQEEMEKMEMKIQKEVEEKRGFGPPRRI